VKTDMEKMLCISCFKVIIILSQKIELNCTSNSKTSCKSKVYNATHNIAITHQLISSPTPC